MEFHLWFAVRCVLVSVWAVILIDFGQKLSILLHSLINFHFRKSFFNWWISITFKNITGITPIEFHFLCSSSRRDIARNTKQNNSMVAQQSGTALRNSFVLKMSFICSEQIESQSVFISVQYQIYQPKMSHMQREQFLKILSACPKHTWRMRLE